MVMKLPPNTGLSCNNSFEDTGLIDYDELDKINVEIALEIGESDEYIPGHMGQLFLASDGTMLVSDGQVTIEQFNAEGMHIATVAREGRGPGELSSMLFSLFDGGNDTLMVQDYNSMQIISYNLDRESEKYVHYKSTVLEDFKGRSTVPIGPYNDTAYYAINNNHDGDMFEKYSHTQVVITDALNNILQDSLHLLKVPNSYTEQNSSGGGTSYGIPPYQYHDRFRLTEDDRYMIARPESTALFIYNSDHELDDRLSLNVKERPVQRVDLDRELRNISPEVRRDMEARMPDVKPPFLNIWISEDHLLLHTDNSEEGKHFVMLTRKGEPLGQFRLSMYDDIQYFRDGKIYALHKNQEIGHRIRIYQVYV